MYNIKIDFAKSFIRISICLMLECLPNMFPKHKHTYFDLMLCLKFTKSCRLSVEYIDSTAKPTDKCKPISQLPTANSE